MIEKNDCLRWQACIKDQLGELKWRVRFYANISEQIFKGIFIVGTREDVEDARNVLIADDLLTYWDAENRSDEYCIFIPYRNKHYEMEEL